MMKQSGMQLMAFPMECTYEQNGVFKMELVQQKQFVLEKKMEIGLDFKSEKKDIIGMVKRAFPLAFGNEENNKKVTTKCGWSPLNCMGSRSP